MSTITLPLNTQPVEKTDWKQSDFLDTIKVFRTIQGEGPFAGRPSVFIRLAGCNLQCPQCDTDYTTGRIQYKYKDLASTALGLAKTVNTDLIVLTGGEPFRQNISSLCRDLLCNGLKVQIETNGSLYLEDFPYYAPELTVVCSPKTGSINPKLPVDYYKYVVQHGWTSSMDGLPIRVLGKSVIPARPDRNFNRAKVYVQPCDEGDVEKNKHNLREAINSCMQFGYTLSLQLHKIIGLD